MINYLIEIWIKIGKKVYHTHRCGKSRMEQWKCLSIQHDVIKPNVANGWNQNESLFMDPLFNSDTDIFVLNMPLEWGNISFYIT